MGGCMRASMSKSKPPSTPHLRIFLIFSSIVGM